VKSRELKSPSLLFQVTVIQADAADETAIKTVCEEAIQEEGRLDVFFANVRNLVLWQYRAYWGIQAGIVSVAPILEITSEQFMNTFRVNSLSFVFS